MRKAWTILLFLLLAIACVAQQGHAKKLTVTGCINSTNGAFKLINRAGDIYILKGDHDTLFGYNGALVEATGTVDPGSSNAASEGVPVVLHVTKLKKLANVCG